MSEAMATGRMDANKKARVSRILNKEGLNISLAINLFFDRIEEEGTAKHILSRGALSPAEDEWKNAAQFVDSLSEKRAAQFDGMTKAEIKAARLRSRGLM